MTEIVVGHDGSSYSDAALRFAAEEARLRDLPLVVVSVVNWLGMLWPGEYTPAHAPGQEQVDRHHAQVEARVRSVLSEGAGEMPAFTVRTPLGNPVDELLAQSANATLLVVGCRGAGGFERMLLGSVSTGLVHHASCPVTVVRG
jgi:nucleotide-binding universal stress UspA family protein